MENVKKYFQEQLLKSELDLKKTTLNLIKIDKEYSDLYLKIQWHFKFFNLHDTVVDSYINKSKIYNEQRQLAIKKVVLMHKETEILINKRIEETSNLVKYSDYYINLKNRIQKMFDE